MQFYYILLFRLQQAKDLREVLLEKLKVSIESTLSAEARTLRLEELLNNEEKHQEEMMQELKLLGDTLFKKDKETNEARTNEKMTEASISVSLLLIGLYLGFYHIDTVVTLICLVIMYLILFTI